MKVILKPIFEWLTGDFALFDNPLYNYIVMAVIGIIAFGVAFSLVGALYRAEHLSSRGAGSIIHWAIRLIVFVIIFYIFSALMWLVQHIIAAPWLSLGIFMGALVLIIGSIIAFKQIMKGKHRK